MQLERTLHITYRITGKLNDKLMVIRRMDFGGRC